MLISGMMNEKKAVYIIPEMDPAGKEIEIPEDAIRTFQTDYNRRKNTLTFDRKSRLRDDEKAKKQLQAFFALPGEGEIKPVFYVRLPGKTFEGTGEEKLYFGFTPRLRTYYDYSVAETLEKTHQKGIHDYVTGIFGCADAGTMGSWKSKVSFSDAVIRDHSAREMAPRILVLGEPRASDYLNYLQPDEQGKAVNYNRSYFRLRGVKQYWLHQQADPGLSQSSAITTTIYPLDRGNVFCGKIRFQNMYPDELGLLLWSLCLEKNSVMNIGMAKPYGYGAVKAGNVHLKLWNPGMAYDLSLSGQTDLSASELVKRFLEPFDDCGDVTTSGKDHTISSYIDNYRKAINRKLGGRDIMSLPSVQDLLLMKDANAMPDARNTRYMELSEFTEAMRYLKVLPEPAKVAKKE